MSRFVVVCGACLVASAAAATLSADSQRDPSFNLENAKGQVADVVLKVPKVVEKAAVKLASVSGYGGPLDEALKPVREQVLKFPLKEMKLREKAEKSMSDAHGARELFAQRFNDFAFEGRRYAQWMQAQLMDNSSFMKGVNEMSHALTNGTPAEIGSSYGNMVSTIVKNWGAAYVALMPRMVNLAAVLTADATKENATLDAGFQKAAQLVGASRAAEGLREAPKRIHETSRHLVQVTKDLSPVEETIHQWAVRLLEMSPHEIAESLRAGGPAEFPTYLQPNSAMRQEAGQAIEHSVREGLEVLGHAHEGARKLAQRASMGLAFMPMNRTDKESIREQMTEAVDSLEAIGTGKANDTVQSVAHKAGQAVSEKPLEDLRKELKPGSKPRQLLANVVRKYPKMVNRVSTGMAKADNAMMKIGYGTAATKIEGSGGDGKAEKAARNVLATAMRHTPRAMATVGKYGAAFSKDGGMLESATEKVAQAVADGHAGEAAAKIMEVSEATLGKLAARYSDANSNEASGKIIGAVANMRKTMEPVLGPDATAELIGASLEALEAAVQAAHRNSPMRRRLGRLMAALPDALKRDTFSSEAYFNEGGEFDQAMKSMIPSMHSDKANLTELVNAQTNAFDKIWRPKATALFRRYPEVAEQASKDIAAATESDGKLAGDVQRLATSLNDMPSASSIVQIAAAGLNATPNLVHQAADLSAKLYSPEGVFTKTVRMMADVIDFRPFQRVQEALADDKRRAAFVDLLHSAPNVINDYEAMLKQQPSGGAVTERLAGIAKNVTSFVEKQNIPYALELTRAAAHLFEDAGDLGLLGNEVRDSATIAAAMLENYGKGPQTEAEKDQLAAMAVNLARTASPLLSSHLREARNSTEDMAEGLAQAAQTLPRLRSLAQETLKKAIKVDGPVRQVMAKSMEAYPFAAGFVAEKMMRASEKGGPVEKLALKAARAITGNPELMAQRNEAAAPAAADATATAAA